MQGGTLNQFKVMKFKNILFLLLTISFWNCKSEVSLFRYFDKNASFTLHVKDSALNISDLKGREIFPHDTIYLEFMKWMKNNESGWQSTMASFSSEAFIEQGKFRLLYLKDGGVVLIFIDKENKVRQYSKASKKGELNFLTKSTT